MVAYSFRRRFVVSIQVGLGLPPMEPIRVHRQCGEMAFIAHSKAGTDYVEPYPKRQTIRADRKRHARPGEEIQLYCGMRTKHCFLIGRARCRIVAPIGFWIGPDYLASFDTGVGVSDEFARDDGFADATEMWEFWRREHGTGDWRGVIIKWEPLA